MMLIQSLNYTLQDVPAPPLRLMIDDIPPNKDTHHQRIVLTVRFSEPTGDLIAQTHLVLQKKTDRGDVWVKVATFGT